MMLIRLVTYSSPADGDTIYNHLKPADATLGAHCWPLHATTHLQRRPQAQQYSSYSHATTTLLL